MTVEIRCERCRTPLHTIDAFPTDWSGEFSFRRCSKCWVPNPGTEASAARLRNRHTLAAGKFYLHAVVTWERLRDELLAMGVELDDAKKDDVTIGVPFRDPAAGQPKL